MANGPATPEVRTVGTAGRVPRTSNVVIAGLAAVPLLNLLARNWSLNAGWNYPAGEWLINYHGGIARRGLGGFVMTLAPWPQRVSVIALVALLGVCVPALFAILLDRSLRLGGSALALIWWFIPGGLLLGMWQDLWQPIPSAALLFATRKEMLLYAWLLCFVLIVARRRSWAVLGAFGLLLALGVFVHEGFALMALCAGGAYSVISRFAKRYALWVGLPFLVAIGLLATIPVRDPQANWSGVDPATQAWLGAEAPLSFFFVSFGPQQAMQLVHANVMATGQWRSWLLLGLLVWAWVLAATWLNGVSMLRAYLIAAPMLLAPTVALCFVGMDWGRWITAGAVMASCVLIAANRGSSRRPTGVFTIVVAAALVVIAVLVGVPEAGQGAGGLLR